MEQDDERRFRASRVLGLESPERDAPVGAGGAPRRSAPDPPPRSRRALPGPLAGRRQAHLGPDGRRGMVTLAVSVVVLILLLVVPWYAADGQNLSRSDAQRTILPSGIDYFDRTVDLPVWGLLAGMGAGVVFLLLDVLSTPRWLRALGHLVIAGVLVVAGFLLLLATTRLLGDYVLHLLDSRPTAYHAHFGLYLLAAGGTILFVMGLGAVRRAVAPIASLGQDEVAKRVRSSSRMALWSCALGLLLLPLLPLATSLEAGAEPRLLGEGEVHRLEDAFTVSASGAQDLAKTLDRARLMLWFAMAASTVTLSLALTSAWGSFDLLRRTLFQGFLLNIVFAVVLLVMTILLYVRHVPSLEIGFIRSAQYGPYFNHVLPAVLGVLVWSIVRFVRGVTVPFIREAVHAARQAEAPSDASSE